MKIVADANIVRLEETFGQHGHLRVRPGRRIVRGDLEDADALLVRSITRVDHDLLKGTPIAFVGSATIGTDHLDTRWLKSAGIAWANAPGCNANAAAQYSLAMILLACRRLDRDPFTERVGIIGRGNVGSRLQALLDALEISSVACDPPLADSGVSDLVGLTQALDQTVITLHVPLSTSGPYPTTGMIGAQQLANMPRGALLVNTARGAVVEGASLLDALQSGHVRAALDVWPQEPEIQLSLLRATTVATPHVAGYSEEGKLAGTQMIYEAYCRHFDLLPATVPDLPDRVQFLDVPPDIDCGELLPRAVLGNTQVERDDQNLRALCDTPGNERTSLFDRLRSEYPPRREFGTIQAGRAGSRCSKVLTKLGFEPVGM